MNFPDLFTTPMAKLEPAVAEAIHRIGTVHETHLGLDIPDVLGLEQARDIGAILFALRHGMGSVGELRERVSRRESLPALLDLLEEIEYVARDSEGRYALLIPVLDADDQELVGDALAISRATISEWLEENHRAIRNELSSLTAIRQGVSFEGLFTQIWHDLFGRVTRELATVGLTADPRDPELKYQGSLGAVWRHGVVDSPFR
jgi:hypothetical protein